MADKQSKTVYNIFSYTKYREKFYDEELENKMKEIDNQKENFKFENNETDEMLNKIDQKILELDEEYKDQHIR